MARHRNKPSKKTLNDTPKTLLIDSLAHDGRGVGRSESGKVVFVDGALPEEKVLYQETEQHKRFSKGVVIEVLNPSSDRVTPKCSVFDKCGGCSLQHLENEKQIIFKQQQLTDNLKKIADIETNNIFDPIVAKPWAYRRRVRFGTVYAPTKKELRFGFRAKNTHFIQPTQHCDLIDPRISQLLPELKSQLSQLDCVRDITGVEICIADNTTALIIHFEGMMLGVDSKLLIQFAQEHSIQVSIKNGKETERPLHPKPTKALSYPLPDFDLTLEFSATDFTQVNPVVNEKLVNQAVQLLELKPNDRVLDLFCGLGNFTLPIAKSAKQVVGIEGSDTLVNRAKLNANLNQINNTEFYLYDLYKEFNSINHGDTWFNQHFDKILLDPPRAGAAQLIQEIDRFQARKIVYVSCDHATLARDSKVLINEHGYRLSGAGVADMFPQTAHIESIAVFEKEIEKELQS